MLKRFFLLVFVVLFSVSSSAYGMTHTPATSMPERQDDDTLRVGLISNAGGTFEDGGFNQSAFTAVQRIEEDLDAEVTAIEALAPDEYPELLSDFAEDGYNVVVTVGFDMAEATINAAQEYPDVHFIGVDQFQGEVVPNVTGLIFPEDHAGFLAGVLATGLTETGTVGGVFGPDSVPPVVAFKEGYESGVEWASDELDKEVTAVTVYHPGDATTGFTDTDWGASSARFMLDVDNADIIFTAAGGTGNGALEETAFSAEEDGPPYCIGVDTDQWQTISQAHPCLVSSAVKLITDGVYNLIVDYTLGNIEGGNAIGPVGLAPFHDFEDEVPENLKNLLDRASNGLRTGSILTCLNLDLSDLRIGMVTDVGEINDGSFNESTWNGIQAAVRCGAEADYIETMSPADYAANIAQFADDEYDIIVVVGFALQEATVEAAEAYEGIRFIGVDHFYEDPVEGVTALVFNEDHAGFLAGVLAANLTETDVVANVLGTSLVPPVVAFAEGFTAGVEYIDPDINVITSYHPGTVEEAFLDPQWGATTARQALDQDADVVFAAGGVTGNGALIEVGTAAEDGNPPYCIGVDTDQWFTVPEARPCLVTSAIKYLDGGVATMIVQSYNETLEDGNFTWLVGLAPFHDFEDDITDELKAELDIIAEGLATGQIEIGSDN